MAVSPMKSNVHYDLHPSGLNAGFPMTGDGEWYPDMEPQAALRQIVAGQLEVVEANAPHVLAGTEVEALHDTRVAYRRMRECCRLLAAVLRPATGRVLIRELKWLGGTLGVVRDLDIVARELERLSRLLPAPDRVPMRAYAASMEQERAAASDRLRGVLASRRVQNIHARMRRLGAGEPGPLRAGRSATLHACVQPVLGALRDRALRHGRRIDRSAADTELHRLRVICKRLRYACEFLAPAYGRNVARYAGEVQRVQDLLGDHQDGVVSLAHLRRGIGMAYDCRRTGIDLGALLRAEHLLIERQRLLRNRYAEVWDRFAAARVQRLIEQKLAS
jgi:CHAD domain-containing protein